MKECTKCKKVKENSDFYKANSFNDGLTYSCKKCMTDYRNENKLKNKEYAKNMRETNPKKVRDILNKSYKNKDPRIKVFQGCRQRAKARGIYFDLEIEDIVIPKECPYLKVPFIVGSKGDYQYTHSIDRIDNSKGYIKENVEIITMKANSMKNNATNEELITFALEIIKRNTDKDIVQAMLKDIEVEDKEPLR